MVLIERPPGETVTAVAIISAVEYSVEVTASENMSRKAVASALAALLSIATSEEWDIEPAYLGEGLASMAITCSASGILTISPADWSDTFERALTADVESTGSGVVNQYQEQHAIIGLPIYAPVREQVEDAMVLWRPTYRLIQTYLEQYGEVPVIDVSRERHVVVVDRTNPNPYRLDDRTGYLALQPLSLSRSMQQLGMSSMQWVQDPVECLMLDFEVT